MPACRSAFFSTLATCFVLFASIAARGGDAAVAREHRRASYYVLALSWSPTYCGTNVGRNDLQQCGRGRRYAFVAHGLWPQYDQGWPEFCDTREGWVSEENIKEMLPIMPSRKLVIHQWKKHGSCSGLEQAAYFDLTQELFEKVRIPARYLSPNEAVVVTPGEIVNDFIKTNKNLRPEMISVQCSGRGERARLTELRICFDLDGAFSVCGQNERRQCNAGSIMLPPVR
jgi:ribonuclease T2